MKLEGKTIDFLGDSITEGHGVTDIENNRFDNVIKHRCSLKAVYNYGVGGTRLAHQIKPSETPRHDLNFCARAYDLNHDADIIIVFGGVNDYGHGDAPIGTEGDNRPDTFYGAVEWLMTFLQKQYAGKTIVFLTPAHMNGDMTPHKNCPTQTDTPMPLKGYVDIIEKTAKKHNIPVLNMYEKLPLDPNIPEICEQYTADGLHFNDRGHAVIADTIISFLEEI